MAYVPGTCLFICLRHLMKNCLIHGGKGFAYDFVKCVDKYRKFKDFKKGWQEL